MRRWSGLVLMLAGCGRLGFGGDDDGTVSPGGESEYALAIEADAPVAYWRFGEADGAVVRDSAGTAHGTILGGVTRVAGATNDGDLALRFDGVSGRVELGDIFPFGGTTPYTIELWAKRDAADDKVRWIIERRVTAQAAEGWQLYTGKDFTLHSRTTTDVEHSYAGSTELRGATWTHIAATYDGSSAAMYINGEYTGGMLGQPINAGSGMLVLGDLVAGQFYKFDGVLDEVALYDVALAPARIRAHVAAADR